MKYEKRQKLSQWSNIFSSRREDIAIKTFQTPVVAWKCWFEAPQKVLCFWEKQNEMYVIGLCQTKTLILIALRSV